MKYKVIDNKYIIVKDVLIKEFKLSKRLILKLKQENKIYVNNIPEYVNYRIKLNDIVSIDLNFSEECDNIIPYKMDLNIIYEDDYLIVLDKPAKIETHPTVKNYNKTLANGLKYYFDSINLKKKIRPVNRLDKDTSGIIIFAKNQYIQEELIKQMKNNIFKKEYLAIVNGKMENDCGVIEANISRKEGSIIERCINENGAYAKTIYNVIRILNNNMSYLKIKLETGRTHQIRVHMKYIGHPLIGDYLYNQKSNLIDRQALHSYKISFCHPVYKKIINFIAPIPADILNILNNCENK